MHVHHPLPYIPNLPRPALAPFVRLVEPRIPFRLKKAVLETALNNAFKALLEDDEFYFMEDQRLGLEVRDLGIRITFTCADEKLVVCTGDEADAWIKGDAAEFLKLANRQQDPDTLFFQRKLLIEGDTELGLAVKNLLDSFDWSELPPLFQKGLGVVGKLA